MKAKIALALLVCLLNLGIFVAGCATPATPGKGDPYEDQRKAEEIEWNLEPWR